MTRRDATRLLSAASIGAWWAPRQALGSSQVPALAAGAPQSPERIALIDAFQQRSGGTDKKFAARTHRSDWVMPYRLFTPSASGRLPLVLYLHGSGGAGNDNEKQLGLGNIYGTRLWALPENQARFPCYVVAPQTNRGWVQYDGSKVPAEPIPGFGDGNRLALQIVDGLCREFPIDRRRLYVTGQSMGGAGVWNLIANRPAVFAAAAICCAGASSDDGTGAVDVPVWNFHGAADKTVDVAISRARIAARRKAGGRPIATEYAGVDHDCWQWAYTEPELLTWLFAQRQV